jgi:transposase
MRPCSMDLRGRVAAAVDEEEGSQREIARLFRVSLSFVFRLLGQRRDRGTLSPKPHEFWKPLSVFAGAPELIGSSQPG